MNQTKEEVLKFRKKPVVIEAVLWDGNNVEEVRGFIGYVNSLWGENTHDIYIQTLEGVMRADRGDWIIKGVKGEFYPCKPDIFAATYNVEES